MSARTLVSVVIPTLEEAGEVAGAVASALAGDPSDAGAPGGVEVIVADAASGDGTAELARRAGARTVEAAGGRGAQMNAGARLAAGEILLFLHADTRLPPGWLAAVAGAMAAEGVAAGAFRLRIDAPGTAYRVIEAGANLRSRLLGLPYGDQALFLRADSFRALRGFPEVPIMEDFLLVRRLRRLGRIALLDDSVNTSARRWRTGGVWRTTFENYAVVLGWMAGFSPESLADWCRRNGVR